MGHSNRSYLKIQLGSPAFDTMTGSDGINLFMWFSFFNKGFKNDFNFECISSYFPSYGFGKSAISKSYEDEPCVGVQ